MKMYFGRTNAANRTISEHEMKRNALLSDLEKTKRALEIAYSGFDNVTEPDLIDCYIYEVNAIMKRYQFLMAQADLLSSNGLCILHNRAGGILLADRGISIVKLTHHLLHLGKLLRAVVELCLG